MNKLNMQSNPVRFAVWIAGLLAAIGTALIDLDSGVQLGAAIGKALLSLSVVAGGAEVARAKAWAPDTVNEIMDADKVIAAAEAVADDDGETKGT